MARIGKLAAIRISKASGPAVLHDGGGLYLRVSAGGAKSWVFRFQIGGKRRDMGLGAYPDLTLADARSKAAEHRKQRNDGIDPLDAKDAQRAAQRLIATKGRTFRECAVEYIAKHRSGWRSAKHLYQWERSLESYAYPTIGDLPVSAIDTGLVVRVLDLIWSEKPETGSRLRGRIEAVLDSAIVQGFRQGPNPAQWKGNLAHILPRRGKLHKVEHYPALPFGELPAFLPALRSREGVAALALEFLIFTAARPGEVTGATWDEIDLDAKVWTVPADRTKAQREHRKPLTEPALALLKATQPLLLPLDEKLRVHAPIFPGRRRARPLMANSMLKLLHSMGRNDITAHGFRSTFRDWVSERTGFAGEIAEMQLAHAIESKTESAYRRGDLLDRRRELMNAWARFCEGVDGGEVVPLRATR
jgi:integrase